MKPKKIEYFAKDRREILPLRIVTDAAMSTRGLHGGRILPVVLLDTAGRPDIDDLIRLHQIVNEPGDYIYYWGQIEGHKGTVAIFLKFIRPVEILAIIEFDIVRHGFLIDLTLSGQGIYIARANGEDDLFSKAIDRPRLLVELGDTGFGKKWNEIFHKQVAEHFRDSGLSKSQSINAAKSAISELRKIGSLKMNDIIPSFPAE